MTQSPQFINELKSYTEYNVNTPTSVFTIGFQYEYNVDVVNVYVDGVEATAAGYDIQHDSHGTITLEPAVPTGVVRLQRETDIDASAHSFSAGAKFTAGNMDENFEQIRHSQQEVRDGFSKLSDDTYAIIDTLQDVGQAAQDAADAAEQAAITANDAAAQVNDKVSQSELDYIHENGAALPYNPETVYEENAVVVKDGALQQLKSGIWLTIGGGQRQTLNTIAELKVYTPQKNDEIVEVVDYDVNVQGIFNKYIYRASSNLADNYGTVIASDVVAGRWIMLPKSEYIPEDFGVVSGDTPPVGNAAKLTAFLQSGLNLYIPPKKYATTNFTSVSISKPTQVRGASISSSILERLRIFILAGADGSSFKDFRVNTLSNNYSFYNNGSNYVVFERIHAYDNYDGIAFYSNANTMKGCVVRDCISERSRRIGFTVDIGAQDTLLENNTAIDCRQGFHFEGDVRSTALNSKTIRCGRDSPTGVGEQDSYAGSLRSYGTTNLTVDGFENINPAGVNYWQHGGGGSGSSNLVFKNFKGVGNLILDDAVETTTNMHFENMDASFGIFRSANKQVVQGRIVIKNVVGASDLMIGGSTTSDVYLEDAKVGRLNISCGNLFLHNVQATTQYNHTLAANNIVGTGLLENNQTAYQETNGGFYFDMSRCVRILLDSIRMYGSSGVHLSFANLNRTITKKIDLGEYMPDVSAGIRINGTTAFLSSDFVKYNIRYTDVQRIYKSNAIPTSGIFQVGDVVYKTTVSADTIYGWVCTTAGTDTAAVWKPLKHDA